MSARIFIAGALLLTASAAPAANLITFEEPVVSAMSNSPGAAVPAGARVPGVVATQTPCLNGQGIPWCDRQSAADRRATAAGRVAGVRDVVAATGASDSYRDGRNARRNGVSAVLAERL